MSKDIYTGKWILQNSLEIIDRYEKGMLTLRALHYQLVGIGMTNSLKHYKRVVTTMIQARWDGLVDFDTFSDHDRAMIGSTDYETIILHEQIEKYIERLKTLQNLYEEGQPQHNAFGIAIVEANEMIVKNCSIPAVVGRSEQLVCSCGSRLVKTTGGYHCGNAKCSV